jgi:NAD(P)-dependent dehydrogenase (short-subunit alcohol dehydrogenase family)
VADQPSLDGRTALVIGAGRGAGEAIARALAAAGARVCAADLTPDRAERAAAGIRAEGGEAFGWQVDASSKFQLAAAVETTRDRYGSLDVLVQAAHAAPADDPLRMDEWSLRRTVEVNVVGVFLAAQLAARVMADEGGGAILLLVQEGEGAVFRATQAAVEALAAALGDELAGHGIRIASLAVTSPQDTARRALDALRSSFPN